MGTLSEALLPGLVDAASVTTFDNHLTIEIAERYRIIQFSRTHPAEDLTRFAAWCVRPPLLAEAAVRELRDRAGGGRAIGHVFPIASLDPNSMFCAAKLEGAYQKIYSSVAVSFLIERGIGNSSLRRVLTDLGDETPLADLFDQDLAVVVVGLENLERAGNSLPQAQLMLQEAGYFVSQIDSEYSWTRIKPAGVASCVIGRVAGDLSDSTDLFSRIVCLASQQTSAVASLLIYYQVIEVVSDRLLGARLTRLAANPPVGSWNLKESIREAVSEKSRIISVCGQAAVKEDVGVFLRMRDYGVKVLNESGENADSNEDPGAVLYLVRNLVVHNQSAITVPAHGYLNLFVAEMHAAMFAVIRRLQLATAT